MKHLPGPQQQALKALHGLVDYIAKKVEENQRTLDPNSPRNFIDSFLIRMQKVRASSHAERTRAKQRELRLPARENRALSDCLPHTHGHDFCVQIIITSIYNTLLCTMPYFKNFTVFTYLTLPIALGESSTMSPLLELRNRRPRG